MKKSDRRLIEYKQAVWEYMLEHGDVTKGGALFVKFHTDGRSKFEGHVQARVRGSHREDPVEKQKKLDKSKEDHLIRKAIKSKEYRNKKKRRLFWYNIKKWLQQKVHIKL